jgi:hypothetical protein
MWVTDIAEMHPVREFLAAAHLIYDDFNGAKRGIY